MKKNQCIAVFLLALPFLNESFPTNPMIYQWIRSDLFKYLSFAVLSALMIRKKKRPSLLLVILLCLEAMLVVSTLVNRESFDTYDYEKMISDIISILSMGLIIETFTDVPDDLISGLMLNFEIAVYSYFADIVFHLSGEGYYRRGLLATLILWIVPGICIALLRTVISKKYLRSAALILISLFVAYEVWNATTIVALAGMFFVTAAGLVLMRKTKVQIPLGLLIGAAIMLNLFVLFIYRGEGFLLVTFIIEKVLGKSTTFTERDVIWAEAIRMIREKPILGHGSRPVLDVANSFASEYPHSHNQLLQKLNESGVFGLLIFAAFHLELIRKTDRSDNTLGRLFAIAAVFGICMTYITEAYKKFFVFYLVFFIAYHIDELLQRGSDHE